MHFVNKMPYYDYERCSPTIPYGVGAKRATVAHIAEQDPSAALHARIVAGAAAAATTVPNWKPAAA